VVFTDASGQWWRPASDGHYYLGSKDHFPAGREGAEKALSLVPFGRELARANRVFLVRAVRYQAGQGIDQFIDVRTGLPTSPNVHEVAQSVNPDAGVVYVDNDSLVMGHARAMLADSDGVIAVRGDARYLYGFIVTNDAVHTLIDFSHPVGLLFVAVLHFVTGEEDPYSAIAWSGTEWRRAATWPSRISPAMAATPRRWPRPGRRTRTRPCRRCSETRPASGGSLTAPKSWNPGLAEVSRWRNAAPEPAPAAAGFFALSAGKSGDGSVISSGLALAGSRAAGRRPCAHHTKQGPAKKSEMALPAVWSQSAEIIRLR
jgi:hypothetical protein